MSRKQHLNCARGYMNGWLCHLNCDIVIYSRSADEHVQHLLEIILILHREFVCQHKEVHHYG